MVISVAFDTAGEAAVRDWIQPAEPAQLPRELQDIMGWGASECSRAATPTYPCLIDEKHIVAELYNMVNVPSAVWINEEGRVVRPAEPAGASDAFRTMDRTTFQMPEEATADAKLRRKTYTNALRDWGEKGDASIHALSPEEVRRRMRGPTDDHVLAAANFRLGQYLYRQGYWQDAQRYFAEAVRLRPESWNYRRQGLELEETGKAAGPEFWATVDALGEKSYYPPVEMEGMPK